MIKNNNNLILFSTPETVYGPNLMPADCSLYTWFFANKEQTIRWNMSSTYIDNNAGFIRVVEFSQAFDAYYLYIQGISVIKPNTTYKYKVTVLRAYSYPYFIKFAIVTGTDNQLLKNSGVTINTSTSNISLPPYEDLQVITYEGNITTTGGITNNSRFAIDFSSFIGYNNFRIDIRAFELREVVV